MKPGFRCASILVLLAAGALAFGAEPSSFGSSQPDSRAFLRQSAGALGIGTGCAAVALPVTLLLYVFSGGNTNQVLEGEALCLGLGSAAGAYFVGRGMGRPAKFWPALGLAFVPELASALVLGLTGKGTDLSDPVVAGCFAASIIGSPLLATVGANIGSRGARGASTRLELAPELRPFSWRRTGAGSGSTHLSAGFGFRYSF